MMNEPENALMVAVTSMFFDQQSTDQSAPSPQPPKKKPKKAKAKMDEDDVNEVVLEHKEHKLRDRSTLKPAIHQPTSAMQSIIDKYSNIEEKGVMKKKKVRVRKPYKPIAIPKFVKSGVSQLQLDHQKNRTGFSYNPKFKCYLFNGRHRMSGSINLTKRWYYSSFDLELCKKRPKGGKGMKKTKTSDDESNTAAAASAPAPAPPKPRSRGQSIEAAQQLGKRVDHELKYWAIVKEIPPKAHKLTKQLIQFFKIKKWRPISSQEIVGIPDLRVATQYDLYMKTAENERILVEIKTGGGNFFDESGEQKLDEPLQHVESCRRTHAFLEVLFAKICRDTMYPSEPPIKRVYVVRTNGNEVHLYEPSDWVAQAEADMKHRIADRQKPLPDSADT